MWLSRAFHRYFVALEETKAYLTMLGLPADRVTVSGIPVDPAFGPSVDQLALRKKLCLATDRPVILVTAGALGVNPAEQVVKSLRQLKLKAQVVVICGKNPEAKVRVDQEVSRTVSGEVKFLVQGYVENMSEWMASADLLISKPGGMTSAEAMVCHLPMAIYDPIPGQEERNSDQLLENGVAIKCNEIMTLGYKVGCLLSDHERLQRMKESARKMGRPKAAETVVRTLLAESDTVAVEVNTNQQEEMAEQVRKR